MQMTGKLTKRDLYPRVGDFYNGKCVLITGAAGFVGMVILEILLRNVPEINAIYILIREKKGVKPEDRKKKLFQKIIFNQLKEDRPDALAKVRLLPGDVALPNLGMSDEDVQEVIQNVSIVFHCAAIINFLKPPREVLQTNVTGTHNVVELCKKLKTLEALVYTSTMYSNCNRKLEIQEEIYRLPFPYQKFLEEIENGTDESLQNLVSQCHPHWPNTYTFSKCLAENVLLENGHEVPFAIIRPSLVVTTWKAPHPGFAEDNSALVLLATGMAKGFIKVLLVNQEKETDMVPVDVVINAHIIAAWKVATGRSPSPFVVNCTSYGVLHYSWQYFAEVIYNMTKNHTVPNSFRKSDGVVKIIKSILLFRIVSFYEHYVPAYFIDFLLKLSGKKPRLVRLYQLFDKATMSTAFYSLGNWTYATANFRSMEDNLDQEDKEKFYTDISTLTPEKLVDDLPIGNPAYDWKNDKLTQQERKKKAEERYILSKIIQYAFLVITCTILYLIFSQVYRMTGTL